MINNLETNLNYKLFVNNILSRVPLLLTKQLTQCIVNYYKGQEGIDENNALQVLFALQRQGELFLSKDGWTMTKGMYWQLTGDKHHDFVSSDGLYRVEKIDKSYKLNSSDQVIAFWLVAKYMPDSNDFSRASSPWNYVFTTKETKTNPSYLYEVAFLPRSREDAIVHMLRVLPKYDVEEFRKHVKRILIVENPNIIWRIPYVGISDIYVIENGNIKLSESRKPEEVWKEY